MDLIYYLHPCARLSADFVADNFVQKQMIVSGKIISAACNLVTLAEDSETYKDDITSPFILWATESADHVEWLRIYYETLVATQERIHFQDVKAYKIINAFKAAIKLFPRNSWEDPPYECIPADCIIEGANIIESYREFYRKERMKIYKRVKEPYWWRKDD